MSRRRECLQLRTTAAAAVALVLGACSDNALRHRDAGSPEDTLPQADGPDAADRDTPGEARPRCGDGKLDGAEKCDDGNTFSGDGCTALCQPEADYVCPEAGRLCVYIAKCGDGVVTRRETCDDGNTSANDGCSSDCQKIEAGWECRVPGARCTPICGDRMIVGAETCDDGNAVGGDGCSAACQVEPVGPPVCGDGVVAGAAEECDLGAQNAVDIYGGCSTSCKANDYCGDGRVNGPEECDLGPFNGDPSLGKDGCTPACTFPPYCGDGVVDPGEACDNGEGVNASSGVQCSSSCVLLPY